MERRVLGDAIRRGASGFSLVEVLLALGLLGMALLTVAPMFVYGMRKSAASADFGKVGAAAVNQLERLRAASYPSLTAGGSLTTSLTAYNDGADPDVTVRWTIADDATPPTVKTITVVAIAKRAVSGPPKRVQFSTKRSR